MMCFAAARAEFERNMLSGVMPEEICSLLDEDLGSLTADCGSDIGVQIEITCECCTECFQEGDEDN